MASGLSKAHSRQSSANKVRRATRRANAVTEVNQLRRLLRHARALALTLRIGANSSEVTFLKGQKVLKDISEAWRRSADKAGVARAREVLHTRSIPQANTEYSFA